jgi:hypothetical protein
MTSTRPAVRGLLRPLLAASLVAVVLGSGCELFGFQPGWHIHLQNSGRDPIHVAGRKVAQNQRVFIDAIGRGSTGTWEYNLSRNDIDLGKLSVTVLIPSGDDRSGDPVTITMTEPVYFDFRFEVDRSAVVEATYIRP